MNSLAHHLNTTTSSEPHAASPLCWVITSDPQYPRTLEYGYDESKEGKQLSSAQISEQYRKINTFRQHHPLGFDNVPVFINGDITEYYRGYQVSEMNRQIDTLGSAVYVGLGNHDYDNNVNDCYRNGCARDAVTDMVERARNLAPDAFDFKNEIWDSYTGYKLFRGSLAYSKTLGDFTFIQLQNHPAYAVRFETTEDPKWTVVYDITKSLDWLQQQLVAAQLKRKHIIINVHRPPTDSNYSAEDIERFRRLVDSHKVKAIFHGHTHVAQKESNFGTVPVFNSGAAFIKTFLVAETNTRHAEVYVTRATDNKLESKPLGSFRIGTPVTAQRVHATYRIAANEVYVTLHQTPPHQLAWVRAEYTFNGKTQTVNFSTDQNPDEEIYLNFDGLSHSTTYPIKVTGYTDKGTSATYEGTVTTPGTFKQPIDLCARRYPDWQKDGFNVLWKRPPNDNWQGKAMFEVGIFNEDNLLVETITTTPDYNCQVPISFYNGYDKKKYYLGVRAFNMTSPGDKSLPTKSQLYFLPHMNC